MLHNARAVILDVQPLPMAAGATSTILSDLTMIVSPHVSVGMTDVGESGDVGI